MQYCAACPKRDICRQICPAVEEMLQKETGYQKELAVSPEHLEYLHTKGQQSGMLSVWDDTAPTEGNGKLDERILKTLSSPAILNNRQKRILRLHLHNLTHKEISKRMKVSRQQVTKSLKVIKKKVAKYAFIETSSRRRGVC